MTPESENSSMNTRSSKPSFATILALPWHFLFMFFYPIFYLTPLCKLSLVNSVPELTRVSFVLFCLVTVILCVLLRNIRKGTLSVSLAILAYFIYGSYQIPDRIPEYDILSHYYFCTPFLSVNILRWETLVGFTVLALAVYWIKSSAMISLTKWLNVFALFLLLASMVSLIKNETSIALQYFEGMRRKKEIASMAIPNETESPLAMPDIFLIIPDQFTGLLSCSGGEYESVMKNFIANLDSLGFEMPLECQSNYPFTALSVPSMLNMEYLHSFAGIKLPEGQTLNFKRVAAAWADSKTNEFLHKYGYEIIQISFIPLSKLFFDQTIDATLPEYQKNFQAESALIQNRFGTKKGYHTVGAVEAIRQLCNEPDNENVPRKPRYVFCHFQSPHYPICYDKDGNVLEKIGDEKHFAGEHEFAQKILMEMIHTIQNSTNKNCFIIIASDHGQTPFSFPDSSWLKNDMWNFEGSQYEGKNYPVYNSDGTVTRIAGTYRKNGTTTEHPMYAPNYFNFIAIRTHDGKKLDVPQNLTNVNIFRYVFNHIFSANFEILPNEYYYGRSFDHLDRPAYYDVTTERNIIMEEYNKRKIANIQSVPGMSVSPP